MFVEAVRQKKKDILSVPLAFCAHDTSIHARAQHTSCEVKREGRNLAAERYAQKCYYSYVVCMYVCMTWFDSWFFYFSCSLRMDTHQLAMVFPAYPTPYPPPSLTPMRARVGASMAILCVCRSAMGLRYSFSKFSFRVSYFWETRHKSTQHSTRDFTERSTTASGQVGEDEQSCNMISAQLELKKTHSYEFRTDQGGSMGEGCDKNRI